MSKRIGVGGAIKSTLTKWEQVQKEKFIEQAQNPHMRWSDFLVYVENEIKQSKRMSQFNYKILCFKHDGVYQLNRAIQEVFGVVAAAEDKSPSGDDTINTIEVTLSDGQRIKVPYGDIALEELGEGGMISISYNSDTHNLHVKGKCQFKYSSLMDDIIERTHELLANESIFRGHALEITDLSNPKIMNLSNIDQEVMILSKQTQYELQPLESRILHPELCIKKGIPLKFGALLEGKDD